MSFVLVESGTATCQHGGQVKLASAQSKLKVNGAKVLVDGDLVAPPAAISGCLTPIMPPPPGPPSAPCLVVQTATGGVATKLKVQGKGVLLKEEQGTTSGVVAGALNQPWSVQDAGQTKLKAT